MDRTSGSPGHRRPRRGRHRRRRRLRLGLLAIVTVTAMAGAWAAQTRDQGLAGPRTAAQGSITDPCLSAGPAHLAAEKYLAAHPEFGVVIADGKPSAEDCAAIRTMQARFDVAEPSGSADAVTGAIVARLASARTGQCPAGGDGVLVCVDLSTQTMWALRDGELVLGPTIVRTGRPGEATPTGDFTITSKKQRAVSTITGTPMHYWQHLRDGYGFHQAWAYLHDPKIPGSLGCVNMTRRDSEDLFALTETGGRVHIFGHKPGT
jgi:hypothetical protein